MGYVILLNFKFSVVSKGECSTDLESHRAIEMPYYFNFHCIYSRHLLILTRKVNFIHQTCYKECNCYGLMDRVVKNRDSGNTDFKLSNMGVLPMEIRSGGLCRIWNTCNVPCNDRYENSFCRTILRG